MDNLLERTSGFEALAGAFSEAGRGSGQVVLVVGEAGIGKSVFAQQAVQGLGQGARLLQGWCEELSTPRPFGPLLDLARGAGPEVRAALLAGDASALDVLLEDLASGYTPVVLLIEDIHWADAASLDLLTLLCHRVRDLPVTVLLTYRDLPRAHRAVGLIGGLPTTMVTRVALEPLSRSAVSEMAGEPVAETDPLYAETNGNPFYVTELLSAREQGVPATIADAVLARTVTLDGDVRELVDLLSVIPGPCDVELLDRLDPAWIDLLEPAAERGIIVLEGDVRFRHALTRRAIEESLSAPRRRRLNLRVLEVLLGLEDPTLARLIHHAQHAGAVDVLTKYAPLAAREAANASSHRQAVQHYELAIAHPGSRGPLEQSMLHDELTRHYWFEGRQADALAHAREAITWAERSNDRRQLGRVLRSAANLSEWTGEVADYEGFHRRALEVLEPLGATADLAMLYGDLAVKALFRLDVAEAERLAELAVRVADEVDEPEAMSISYVSAAFVEHWVHGERERWDQALSILDGDHGESAVVAVANRAFCAIERFETSLVDEDLAEAREVTSRLEATAAGAFVRVYGARLAMERGDWDDARRELDSARSMVDATTIGPLFQSEYHYVAGRLHARSGETSAAQELDFGWDLVAPLEHPGRLLQLAAAKGEAAWLAGDLDAAVDDLHFCSRILDDPTLPWSAEISFWLWRADAWDREIPTVNHPRFSAMRGNWDESAALWQQRGYLYERAEALTESTEVTKRLEGLAILDDLGAAPLAAAVRRRLREAGVDGIPRGPNRQTRSNPAGLTSRQLDVLALIVEGRTNAEIADQLYLSIRTVDTHVGAILQKLDVSSRREASRRTRDLGIL